MKNNTSLHHSLDLGNWYCYQDTACLDHRHSSKSTSLNISTTWCASHLGEAIVGTATSWWAGLRIALASHKHVAGATAAPMVTGASITPLDRRYHDHACVSCDKVMHYGSVSCANSSCRIKSTTSQQYLCYSPGYVYRRISHANSAVYPLRRILYIGYMTFGKGGTWKYVAWMYLSALKS